VRRLRLSARVLGIEQTVVESSRFDMAAGVFVVSVRPYAAVVGRCGVCRRACAGYDRGRGRRVWRTLDVGVVACYLAADLPRVRCPDHGVVVSWVPWARHGAGHTLVFDQKVAWKATEMSKTAVALELRISWATVGEIIARVTADLDAQAGDPFVNVRRIGIDEVSYKRGFKFLTVVVDHDTRRLLWIAEGRSKSVLGRFFTELGPQRCARIELISADGADWIFHAVQDHCPNARICLDPFHVVAWATKALDEVRRGMWRAIRRSGKKLAAADLRGARYALWKNPEDLTDKQRSTLAGIQDTNKPLYRAYLLKEQLRAVFSTPGGAERAVLLDAWLRWAARCQIPAFADLARRIRAYFRDDIVNTLTHRLSNALVEATNTKIRLLIRRAFGFRSVAALIALVKLHLGGYNIKLPGRT
jgi:transposase